VKILIYHGSLSTLTGGEVNTRDWALGLKGRGHKIVIYTVHPGPLAEQIRREGVSIVDDPSLISEPPDIIFGAGINDVVAAIARFPDVPAIQVAQVYDHWNGYPCPLPQVVLHVAVDERNAEMLINEFGVPRDRIRIVYNAVDTGRIVPRQSALPSRPIRALVLLKAITPFVEAVREACAQRNVAVEFFGYPISRPLQDPLAAMSECDVVIGAARTAIEGAVAGAGVVVADHRGVAGYLTTEKLGFLRRHNFGIAALTQPPTAEAIGAALDEYDPDNATEVGRIRRSEASLDRQLEHLEAIFAEAIELFRDMPPPPEDSRRALASYLGKHLPRPAEGDPSPRHARFMAGVSPADRMTAMENRIAEMERRTGATEPAHPPAESPEINQKGAADQQLNELLAAERDAYARQIAEMRADFEAERTAFAARIHELIATATADERSLRIAAESAVAEERSLRIAAEERSLRIAAESAAAEERSLRLAVESAAAEERSLRLAGENALAEERAARLAAETVSAEERRQHGATIAAIEAMLSREQTQRLRAEAERDGLLASSSWRMTGPLRWLVHRLRTLLAVSTIALLLTWSRAMA